MPIPNGGLITETNQQYYEGAQGFQQDGAGSLTDFTTTFNTSLVFGNYNPATDNYSLNNFKLYKSDIKPIMQRKDGWISHQKTLDEKDLEQIHQNIIDKVSNKFEAKIRS